MPRDWDAATYDRIADPMFRWGGVVVGWLDLEGDETVDAILSTATFHWVRDHDALFQNLAAVLRPGGQLAAQCGGAGNIASIASALAELGADPFGTKVYATPEETSRRLDAGFAEIECWLHPEPVPFETRDDLETYLRAIVLGDHVDGMTPERAREFVHAVVERMPRLEIDYVRLNIRARRSEEPAVR